MPATAAFWTSSKLVRPETSAIDEASGDSPASRRLPMSLSMALWRPTSSRATISSPLGRKRPVACRPPVDANTRCSARSRSGSEVMIERDTTRPSRQVLAGDGELVDRGLAADAAARGREEVPLHARRVEVLAHVDGDDVQVLLGADVLAVADRRERATPCDQALAEEEAGGQLEVVSGRPHRDRDAHGRLPGTGSADLERLLRRQAVTAAVALAAIDLDDPNRGARPAQRGDLGHRHRVDRVSHHPTCNRRRARRPVRRPWRRDARRRRGAAARGRARARRRRADRAAGAGSV